MTPTRGEMATIANEAIKTALAEWSGPKTVFAWVKNEGIVPDLEKRIALLQRAVEIVRELDAEGVDPA